MAGTQDRMWPDSKRNSCQHLLPDGVCSLPLLSLAPEGHAPRASHATHWPLVLGTDMGPLSSPRGSAAGGGCCP